MEVQGGTGWEEASGPSLGAFAPRPTGASAPPLLEIEDLQVRFYLDEGVVYAVNSANFNLRVGETLGIVGESGCGKSVTARAIMRILPSPGRIVTGRILYHRETGDVVDLTALDPRGDTIRAIRGLEIAMVFQEPTSSLSPVHSIGQQIGEAIELRRNLTAFEARDLVIELLAQVGMPEPQRTIDRYPHELSGGMCQRAMIAMALSSYPSLLIADEPTTALDVTTEAQILQLMRTLQHRYGMAIMFITHNLGVIAQMADRVVVMYLGKVVEQARVDDLFHHPLHPYTQALLRSVPRLGSRSRLGGGLHPGSRGRAHQRVPTQDAGLDLRETARQRLPSIRGMVPNAYAIPAGCPFHPRCAEVRPGRCDEEDPPWLAPDSDHWVRCVLYR